MSCYLVMLAFVTMNDVQGDTAGNSLVTCTACQAVQAKDFSCNVNCRVVNGNSGKLIYVSRRVFKISLIFLSKIVALSQ